MSGLDLEPDYLPPRPLTGREGRPTFYRKKRPAMPILERTFSHIRGLKAPGKERALWGQGVETLDDLYRSGLAPPAGKGCDWYGETKRAIEGRDHEFFASRLPKDHLYRVAMAFPEETAFLDIETTGLSRHYDDVTIVGWSLGGDFKAIVKGRDDPGEFRRDMARSKALVTFNGKCFDLPFLGVAYGDLPFPKAHVDLMYLCKNVGLAGWQKSIERQIGLTRLEGDGDGEMAVSLWYAYRRGRNPRQRAAALRELVIYNFADVNSMKLIFDACLERLADAGDLPRRFPDRFKPLASRPDFENSFPCPLDPF